VLLPHLFAGLIVGIVTFTYGLSCAALIFSGPLTPYLPVGVGMAMISATLTAIVVALCSSIPFAIAGVDANAAVILAVIAGAIATQLEQTPAAILPTVWLAIVLSTLLTGLFLFLMGQLRLGRWVRFIPYPVIGGFLAGTGWLTTRGAFTVMAGVPLSLPNLPTLLQPELLLQWLPGGVFALALLGATHRFKHFLVLPTMLLGAIALYHLFWQIVIWSTPVATLPDVFLSPPPPGSGFGIAIADLALVNGSILVGQTLNLAVLMVVVAIAILLNATGIEILTQQEGSLDRELSANGLANLVNGLCGGMAAYLSLNRSVLNYRAQATTPLAGILAGLFCGALWKLGGSLMAYVPKPLLGGLLLYIGINMLLEWVYRSRFKLPRLDYILVIAILIIIAVWGLLQGVALGIVIACFLFAVNYSRSNIVKHQLSGKTHKSKVERPISQRQLLKANGDQIAIFVLQNYLFFGTANTLLEAVRQRLASTELDSLAFLILDFRLVHGLDSSAVFSFIKIKQLTHDHQVKLVLSDLHPAMHRQLQRGGFERGETCEIMPDLDRGMEWCENQIIESRLWRRSRFMPLSLQLGNLFSDRAHITPFMSYLELVEIEAEEMLFHKGEPANALFFLESGQLTVLSEIEGDRTRRIKSLRPGALVGEMGFYGNTPRIASVMANQASRLYRLTDTAFERMAAEHPNIAVTFQNLVIRLLIDRLGSVEQEVTHLLR
ncbi:MAG TPA: SulP family inorganic anion transporter, partial [Chroococcidiopsis sp.]